jgi:intracellular septation protein A
MHYMTQPPQEARAPAAARNRGRLQSLAMIAVFDIGGPLALYALLRSEGLSAVTSLVLSGVFPALGVAIKFIRDRRVDAIGVLVLAGIAVGTLLGLLSGNARLVLVEGSVPTAVFGVVCLGSLWSSRPLMYRVAVEFIGADTPRGREFESLWQYQQFRRVFRVMTIVWGVAYLAEAAARVVIVELTSTGTALAISKVMPYVVAGLLVAWMIAYGNWKRRRGERAGYVPAASAQASPATRLGQTAEANAEPRTGPAGH